MRTRPFKFFFGAALAIMFLFFIARVFLAALVFAAIASAFYFVLRSLVNFFKNITWQGEEYDYRNAYAAETDHKDWREDILPLERERMTDFADFRPRERIIQIN